MERVAIIAIVLGAMFFDRGLLPGLLGALTERLWNFGNQPSPSRRPMHNIRTDMALWRHSAGSRRGSNDDPRFGGSPRKLTIFICRLWIVSVWPFAPALASHDLSVNLLQPLKFRHPFRQAHAVYDRHVDCPVEPVHGLAGVKVEVTGRRLRQMRCIPAFRQFIVNGVQGGAHSQYYSESASTRVGTWITGRKRKLSPSLKCGPACRGSRSVVLLK